MIGCIKILLTLVPVDFSVSLGIGTGCRNKKPDSMKMNS